jgi:hypothetical protein
MELAKKSSSSSYRSEIDMKIEKATLNQFAVCLNNEGYQASLEVGKIYRVIEDAEAKTNGLIRVIDESGEDYPFSKNRSYPIELPKPVETALLAAC